MTLFLFDDFTVAHGVFIPDVDKYAMRSLIDLVESLLEYQEEAGSTITHDGVDYDINAVFDVEDMLPLYDIPVSDLEWVLEYDTPDKKRVRAADYNVPILITIWKRQLVVLDGLHRVAKAVKDGLDTLPSRFLPANLLPLFVQDRIGTPDIKTDEDADLYQVGDKWYYGDAGNNNDTVDPLENEDFSAEDFVADVQDHSDGE